jgi:hypothetical protein
MTDKIFASYDFDVGLAAARPATPTVSDGRLYVYLATDTGVTSIWKGSAWVSIPAAALGFLAQLDAADQSVSNGVYTKCVFDLLLTDTTGGWYSTSTGKFTPQKAGLWFVSASMYFTTAVTISDTRCGLTKNGVHGGGGTSLAVGIGGPTGIAGLGASTPATSIVSMNGTTDFVEADGYVNGTGGSDVIGSGGGATYFMGYFVGP